MSLRSARPASPTWRMAAIATVALGLGGCLKSGPDLAALDPSTTGTVASPEQLRQEADDLGRRYDENRGDLATGVAYARVLKAQGLYGQAVAVLQQTTLRNPNDRPVLGAYGKALADAGRFQEASAVLDRAQEPERPDWRILSVQGAVADQLGRFEQAQQYYDTALKIAPNEPSILSNQGLSFALVRRLDDAERVLRLAAAQPNADARVRRNLAMVEQLRSQPGARGGALRVSAGTPADVASARAASRFAATPRSSAVPMDTWKTISAQDDASPGRPSPNRQASLDE